jgi:predicted AlkP superfamily pyrophosphatase or phosphodiesterase
MTHERAPRPAWRAAMIALAVAACGAPTPSATPKVLILGLDGIRPDRLAAVPTPVLDSLAAQGAFTDAATTRPPTVSGPGWSSMLIGVWADKHGVANNDFTTNAYARYPDVLTRIEAARPALGTLAVLDWPPLGTAASGGPLISDRVDRKLLVDGDSLGYHAADSISAALAAEALATGSVDAAFVYFGDVDEVGHAHGTLSPEYAAAIAVVDRQVGQVLEGLRRRPTYDAEDWLVLVSTDHGRRDDGGHGGDSEAERTIFLLMSGPSVRGHVFDRPPAIVDVAVTALTHLGIPIDPAWGLDGQALIAGGH